MKLRFLQRSGMHIVPSLELGGIIRVFEGKLRYVIEESSIGSILTAEQPGLVLPEQLHHVEPLGSMRMQVEFYDTEPSL